MSTMILKTGSVEDYIIKLDTFKDIRLPYEQNKLIIFDNLPFFKCFRSIIDKEIKSIDTSDIRLKKAKSIDLLAPIYDKNPHKHILANFTEKPATIQGIIVRTYKWLMEEVKPKLFPAYTIASENWTWRLTKTYKEAMHLDIYGDRTYDSFHNVRIFINLDNEPRIWRVSHPLPEIYKQYKDLVRDLAVNQMVHPNEINGHLNKKLDWQNLPFHEIYFAPYSMWLCNSQWIPHQGYRGNKLAAYTFRVKPNSMLNPELLFEKVAYHFMDQICT